MPTPAQEPMALIAIRRSPGVGRPGHVKILLRHDDLPPEDIKTFATFHAADGNSPFTFLVKDRMIPSEEIGATLARGEAVTVITELSLAATNAPDVLMEDIKHANGLGEWLARTGRAIQGMGEVVVGAVEAQLKPEPEGRIDYVAALPLTHEQHTCLLGELNTAVEKYQLQSLTGNPNDNCVTYTNEVLAQNIGECLPKALNLGNNRFLGAMDWPLGMLRGIQGAMRQAGVTGRRQCLPEGIRQADIMYVNEDGSTLPDPVNEALPVVLVEVDHAALKQQATAQGDKITKHKVYPSGMKEARHEISLIPALFQQLGELSEITEVRQGKVQNARERQFGEAEAVQPVENRLIGLFTELGISPQGLGFR